MAWQEGPWTAPEEMAEILRVLDVVGRWDSARSAGDLKVLLELVGRRLGVAVEACSLAVLPSKKEVEWRSGR